MTTSRFWEVVFLSFLFLFLVKSMKSQKQFLQNSDASDNANMNNSFSDKC